MKKTVHFRKILAMLAALAILTLSAAAAEGGTTWRLVDDPDTDYGMEFEDILASGGVITITLGDSQVTVSLELEGEKQSQTVSCRTAGNQWILEAGEIMVCNISGDTMVITWPGTFMPPWKMERADSSLPDLGDLEGTEWRVVSMTWDGQTSVPSDTAIAFAKGFCTVTDRSTGAESVTKTHAGTVGDQLFLDEESAIFYISGDTLIITFDGTGDVMTLIRK